MGAWRISGFPGDFTELRPFRDADTAARIEPGSLAQVLNIEER